MKIAHIVLDEFLDNTLGYGYQMALAPRLDSSPKYREWFRKLHAMDYFIMVDNGAAEGVEMDFKYVVELADYVGADEIVMPDVLYDREATIDAFAENMHLVDRHRRLGVAQGKDLGDWMHCAVGLLTRAVATLGINRAPIKFGGTRGEALDQLEELGWIGNQNFHALGLWADPIREIRDLRGRVRGLDTGAALGFAQAGRILGVGHTGLTDEVEGVELELLRANMMELTRLCHDL